MSTAADQPDLPLAFALPTTLGPYRAADYWKLPEGEPVELIQGDLVVSPAPTSFHQVISAILLHKLLGASIRGGGFVVASPIDVVFSDSSIVQPDLVYVSAQRRGIVKNRIEGSPDLLVEIISPKHSNRDRVQKLALYAMHGVPEYWIVDPQERVIDFLLLDGDRYKIETLASETYSSPLLPEVTLNLREFWADVDRLLNG